MSIICQFDNTVHDSIEELHLYLRRFKMKQEVYWHQFVPRYDKVTHELIPYKDYTQYMSQEFANKNTLKKWLKENWEEGLKWSISWLQQRKLEKNLIYAPSQVELRTLLCPSMPYYEKMGEREGGYYGLTKKIGFLSRYNLNKLVFTPLPKAASIIQDTREQTPLKLSIPTIVQTLNVGDYALQTSEDKGVRIERKSLSDFCGSLSGRLIKRGDKTDSSLKRIERELERAKESNLYVVMMVESNIEDAQRFNYLPQTRHIKATPTYIMHNLRELLVKYPLNFQVIFVNGRVQMVEKMIKIFQLEEQVKTIDLQYAFERGDL